MSPILHKLSRIQSTTTSAIRLQQSLSRCGGGRSIMLKRLFITGALFLTLSFTVPVHAAPIVYTALLAGANEVPPTGSSATGSATFTLNGNLLSIDETFSGLAAPAAAAHIHCCAPPGTNAMVAVPFSSFPNATSGHFVTTVDLSLAGTYAGVSSPSKVVPFRAQKPPLLPL